MKKYALQTFTALSKKQKILPVLFITCTSFALNAQNQNITLPQKSLTIQKIFQEVERQTNFSVDYNQTRLDISRTVNIKKTNTPLRPLLNEIFTGSRFSYKIEKDHIIIKQKRSSDVPVSVSQTKHKITGTILDETGEPVIGANVVEKGTTNGIVTDLDGKFSIQVKDDAVLQISYIGYADQEIQVAGKTAFNILMREDTQLLEEVVVVGYGSVKKSDLTGSVTSVNSESLEKAVVPSVDMALQGKTTGLFVASSTGGMPGSAPSIRIRGSNSINSGNEPLYVIDGLLVYPNNNMIRGSGNFRVDQLSPNTSNILASINPNDIESIDVLKDASATAIYGSRGANGVIIITTKRGKKQGGGLNFDVYAGISTLANKTPLLNAGEYVRMVNKYDQAWGVPPTFTDAEVQHFEQNGGTDWQDEIYRTAFIKNIQLSSSGGNEKILYYLSSAYYDEEGIIKGNDLKRFSIRSNLDITISEKLKVGNSFTVSYNLENAVPTGDRLPNTGPGVIVSAIKFPPTDPVRNDDGSYFLYPSRTSSPISNPVAILETQEMKYKTLRSLGTFFLEYIFYEGLTGKINAGYDLLSRSENVYYPQTTLFGDEVNGAARRLNTSDVTWMTDFLLSYNKTTGRHSVNAVAGFNAQANMLERTLAGRNNFVTDAFGTSNLSGGATEVLPRSSDDKWSLASLLARVNYVYNNKYLFTFSSRYDGSSRFGKNNKWAFFPSGALGWRVSNEPFMEDISVVNNLKLRVSYGITGNQEIGLYRSLSRYVTVNEVFGSESAVGIRPASNGIPNPDLTWEHTSQMDIGFDLSIYNNRLNFTFDYYSKATKDLIMEFPVAVESGFSNVLQNSGKVQNRGIELAANTHFKIGQFNIDFDANFSYNKNKVVDLGAAKQVIFGTSGLANIVGESLNSIYAIQYDGIWQLGEEAEAAVYGREPGDPKFIDLDGNKKYDLTGDRQVIGITQPDKLYGLTTKLNYKNFTLDFLLQGSSGNLIRGGYKHQTFKADMDNATVYTLGHWTPTNPSNTVPSLASLDPLLEENQPPTGMAFEKGDYLRLKNITLAYNLPNRILSRLGVSKCRVYISGQNLLTFTGYTGTDPEVTEYGPIHQGGLYPMAKNYRIGINVGF